MMDMFTVILLICVVTWLVKKKLLSRRKKGGQEAVPEKKGADPVKNDMPDFRVLSFDTGDFTHTDDLAHCVEFELEKAISDLKKDGCLLIGDPFPIVAGSNILILLNYQRDPAQEKESEG